MDMTGRDKMDKLMEGWRKYLNEETEDLKQALIAAGEKECGHANCKLFVQTLSGVSNLEGLHQKEYTSIEDVKTGYVLVWGDGQHYAIYLGDGEILHVEEWGQPPSVGNLEAEIERNYEPEKVIPLHWVPSEEGTYSEQRDYQKESEKIKQHPKNKKDLLDKGPNKDTGGGKGHKKASTKRGKSAPPAVTGGH
tara:strand:+ start:840 stop:1418 length:579 start_codon:yes stop_codon:yes gene_type:complete